MAEYLENGQKVEVLKTENNGTIPVWFPAIVLRSAPKDQKKDKIYVEFQTSNATGDGKPLREFVQICNVRPEPPRELNKLFKAGEKIEALVKNGWRKGQILKVLETSKYQVSINETSRTEELEKCCLRDIKEWVDGSWVAHNLHLQKNGTESEFKRKEIKIRIICSGNSTSQFSKGMRVEVRSDEEGYKGSWYTAVIVDGPKGNNEYLVEYQTLTTDDETEPLKETAKISDIRPCPPKIEQKEQFEMLDEVDAWYNDGWWVGVISKVFGDFKYAVYFWITGEEYEFTHDGLRPHQEWIGGKWIVAFRKKSKLLLKSKVSKLKRNNSGGAAAVAASFIKGQKVEVKSYEDGYRGFWYPSIIREVLGNEKYRVEYQTWRNTDRTKPVEEADVERVRPTPPKIEQTGRFKILEEVDAWHKGGWWVGQICKILQGSRYSVYFKDYDEVKEFQRAKLRPHQDWVNQQWIPANGGWMPRTA